MAQQTKTKTCYARHYALFMPAGSARYLSTASSSSSSSSSSIIHIHHALPAGRHLGRPRACIATVQDCSLCGTLPRPSIRDDPVANWLLSSLVFYCTAGNIKHLEAIGRLDNLHPSCRPSNSISPLRHPETLVELACDHVLVEPWVTLLAQ